MEASNNNTNNSNDSDSDKVLSNTTSEDENKENKFNSSERPSSARSSGSSDSGSVVLRSRFSDLLGLNTLVDRVKKRKSKSPVLTTSTLTKKNEKALVPVTDEKNSTQVMSDASNHSMCLSLLYCLTCNGILKNLLISKQWTTQVTVVLVGVKDLPPPVDDGSTHRVYCKFRLGSEEYTSKSVNHCSQPEWKQRIYLRLYQEDSLELSLWDKGKQKNFMGSTVVDLSKLEKERTHEIHQRVNAGYGDIGPLVHFSVTICVIRDIPNSLDIEPCEGAISANNAISNFKSDWKLVGQLHVKVLGAKGLSSKPSAYCTLELDNEWVQTFDTKSSCEPVWNKSYIFNVYDVTSTLDVKVYDSSFKNALRFESLGRVSIPLLRINNGETRWFGLKNKSNRNSARGNCPRIQLEMTMFWNPIKATVRLLQPKEVKYLKKPPKFDVALVYSNMEFIRDTFCALKDINEFIKRSFEWESKELSFTVLVGWLAFWFYVKMWAIPLVLLLPFFYFWVTNSNQLEKSPMNNYRVSTASGDQAESEKNDTGMMKKIQGLQEMTLTITKGVEYMVSVFERIFNLVSFKVPFLSFLAMLFLVVSAFSFYFIPFNYTMMALGIYKFTRKYLNPDRTLNNDLLDFLSRVPDSEIWKDWNELNVPEPSIKRDSSVKQNTSDSLVT